MTCYVAVVPHVKVNDESVGVDHYSRLGRREFPSILTIFSPWQQTSLSPMAGDLRLSFQNFSKNQKNSPILNLAQHPCEEPRRTHLLGSTILELSDKILLIACQLQMSYISLS